MDAQPCKVSAKSPQNLAPLPIIPRCRSFPGNVMQLATAGQILQFHPVACEFPPCCGHELMRVRELLLTAQKIDPNYRHI